jgi:hypothetical protein
MYEGKIPFDQHGSPVPYVRGFARPDDVVPDSRYVWEDNVPFKTTLVFKRFERGRSAAHAIYAKGDDPSWEATIFLSDLEDVIAKGYAPLYLTGHFEHVKRGQNYGVKLIDIA